MTCSVCSRETTTLSGGVMGCPVHGIRRMVESHTYAVTANRRHRAGDMWYGVTQVPSFTIQASSLIAAVIKADAILGDYHAPSLDVVEV